MWLLNNIRVFVQDRPNQSPQKQIALLQPLNGGSIYHLFGYKKASYSLKGKIVGDADKSAIENLAKDGTTVTVSGYGTLLGDFLINSAKFTQDFSICQTLRTDLDSDAPVYTFELELLDVN